MQFKSISDKIIVKKDSAKEKTDGGIIIPDVCQEKPDIGTVLAVGPGRDINQKAENGGMECNVGDKIVFMPYSGLNFKINSEEFLSIREIDVLAKIEKTD